MDMTVTHQAALGRVDRLRAELDAVLGEIRLAGQTICGQLLQAIDEGDQVLASLDANVASARALLPMARGLQAALRVAYAIEDRECTLALLNKAAS